MPRYKLHYFGVRARGEIIRLVLTVAGQAFEDRRFTSKERPRIKPGLGGKTNHEKYFIDRVLGAVEDLFIKLIQKYYEKNEEKIADMQKALDNEHLPRFLTLFTKYIEESGGDGNFFVGDTGTLADLAVHDVLTTYIRINEELLDKYPELQANRKTTESLPYLFDYLSKRQDSDI